MTALSPAVGEITQSSDNLEKVVQNAIAQLWFGRIMAGRHMVQNLAKLREHVDGVKYGNDEWGREIKRGVTISTREITSHDNSRSPSTDRINLLQACGEWSAGIAERLKQFDVPVTGVGEISKRVAQLIVSCLEGEGENIQPVAAIRNLRSPTAPAPKQREQRPELAA
jgi:hypothetical protein